MAGKNFALFEYSPKIIQNARKIIFEKDHSKHDRVKADSFEVITKL